MKKSERIGMKKDELMSPKIDYAFKELMRNEKIRENFLNNALFLGKKQIQNSILVNTVLRKEFAEDKYGIIDVRVKLEDETEIDIEIQVGAMPYWSNRSLYYLSKMLTEAIKKSETYDSLRKCIGISILDFNLWEDKEFYHSRFQLLETKRGFLFTDKVEFHVLELKKLPKEEDKGDPLYWWGRFLNGKKKEEFEMLVEKKPELRQAYEQLQRVSADEIERVDNISREKAMRDKIFYLKYATEAREKGIEKGIVKGREEEKREIALNLLKKGFSIEVIAESTGLTIEKTRELKSEL